MSQPKKTPHRQPIRGARSAASRVAGHSFIHGAVRPAPAVDCAALHRPAARIADNQLMKVNAFNDSVKLGRDLDHRHSGYVMPAMLAKYEQLEPQGLGALWEAEEPRLRISKPTPSSHAPPASRSVQKPRPAQAAKLPPKNRGKWQGPKR